MMGLDFLHPSTTHQRFDSRGEWLERRTSDASRGFLGSTTVGVILGWSEYKSPWNVWAQVHAPDIAVQTADTSDDDDDSVLNRGLAMEPLLFDAYRQKYGANLLDPGHVRVYRGRYAVSPDAFVYDDRLGWGVCEGKTVMLAHSHWVPRDDTFVVDDLQGLTQWPMPRAYLSQALAMCIGTGLPFCDLFAAVVIETDDPRCAIATDEFPNLSPHAIVRTSRIRVIPSAEDLATMNGHVRAWVKCHLIEGEPPPLDDSKPCWLHSLGEDPATREFKVEASEEQAAIIVEYLEGRDRRKAGEKAREIAKARLAATMKPQKLRSVYVTTDHGKRITATISTNGRLTVKEPKA